MIPAFIDYQAIISDLNRWGIVDFKIEMICGLSRGHVSQLKSDAKIRISYDIAARLYNFWWDERELHPTLESEWAQTVVATT